MKIYTKTGDTGETGLFGGPRVRKDAVRIEAYGTVDELNAVLGMVRAEVLDPDLDELVSRIQNELFDAGAELATPDAAQHGLRIIADAHVARLERAIDDCETGLSSLKQFILPGGTRGAALVHFARTVCRRAERRVVTLGAVDPVSPYLLKYLNRLSDLLFVLAREINRRAAHPDVPWEKSSGA